MLCRVKANSAKLVAAWSWSDTVDWLVAENGVTWGV